MNKLFKNLTIGILIFSILISTTVSCKKENLIPVTEPNTEEIIVEKAWWWVAAAIVAVVVVIVECTEGQYSSTTTQNPDGSWTQTTECRGLGHCVMHVQIPPAGGNSAIEVSSVNYYEQPDFVGEGVLGFDKEGHIVLVMENTSKNSAAFDSFFYGEKISISRPLIIDNPNVLKLLNSTDKIVVQGDYEVHSYNEKGEDLKYIIIK